MQMPQMAQMTRKGNYKVVMQVHGDGDISEETQSVKQPVSNTWVRSHMATISKNSGGNEVREEVDKPTLTQKGNREIAPHVHRAVDDFGEGLKEEHKDAWVRTPKKN